MKPRSSYLCIKAEVTHDHRKSPNMIIMHYEQLVGLLVMLLTLTLFYDYCDQRLPLIANSQQAND